MKANCVVCHKSKSEEERRYCFFVQGQGPDAFCVCNQCKADARLGRLVRQELDRMSDAVANAKNGEVGLSDEEQDRFTYLSSFEAAGVKEGEGC